MRPDIKLNELWVSGLGWLRESVNFPTPQSQTNTIVVPGRNSPIRYTEALGRVSYQPRSFEIVLSMLGTRTRFIAMVSTVVNQYAGQLTKVICSEEPGLYAIGTLEMAPAYDPLTGKGQLTISCSDGDAYRYHVEETVVTVTGGGTVYLDNDYMPVVPVITATAETALGWQVGTDTFQKTVSSGTWEFPEMELQAGRNTISVTGSGSVTFRYREGCL